MYGKEQLTLLLNFTKRHKNEKQQLRYVLQFAHKARGNPAQNANPPYKLQTLNFEPQTLSPMPLSSTSGRKQLLTIFIRISIVKRFERYAISTEN